jgi:hypothetical protein
MTLTTSGGDMLDKQDEAPGTPDQQQLLMERIEALEKRLQGQAPSGQSTEQLVAAIGEAIRLNSIQGTPGLRVFSQPRDISQIDEKDYLEEPVPFFRFAFAHTIHDDYRRGQAIKPPYGAIKFKNLYRHVRKTGDRNTSNTVCMCIAVIHSKKEVEWLRQHSEYNLTFFEEAHKAASLTTQLVGKLIEATQIVSNMTEFEMIRRHRDEQLKPSTNSAEMKRELVWAMATRMVNQVNPVTPLPMTNWLDEAVKHVQLTHQDLQ